MTRDRVIDTMVLQKANAPLTDAPIPGRRFAKRLAILQDLSSGTLRAVVSKQLIAEYQRQVPSPRNEFVTAFFAILSDPTRYIVNWARWSGALRANASNCRFSIEDTHVLRTAVRDTATAIVTEEKRMLKAAGCIHRQLGVSIIGIE